MERGWKKIGLIVKGRVLKNTVGKPNKAGKVFTRLHVYGKVLFEVMLSGSYPDLKVDSLVEIPVRISAKGDFMLWGNME